MLNPTISNKDMLIETSDFTSEVITNKVVISEQFLLPVL